MLDSLDSPMDSLDPMLDVASAQSKHEDIWDALLDIRLDHDLDHAAVSADDENMLISLDVSLDHDDRQDELLRDDDMELKLENLDDWELDQLELELDAPELWDDRLDWLDDDRMLDELELSELDDKLNRLDELELFELDDELDKLDDELWPDENTSDELLDESPLLSLAALELSELCWLLDALDCDALELEKPELDVEDSEDELLDCWLDELDRRELDDMAELLSDSDELEFDAALELAALELLDDTSLSDECDDRLDELDDDRLDDEMEFDELVSELDELSRLDDDD